VVELIRKEIPMPGKRVQFDEATWNALDLLARDRTLRQSVGTPEKNAVINIAKRGAAPSVRHGPKYRVAARTGNAPKE
jgi:hypothetical protein